MIVTPESEAMLVSIGQPCGSDISEDSTNDALLALGKFELQDYVCFFHWIDAYVMPIKAFTDAYRSTVWK
jgi:hypothetical protein